MKELLIKLEACKEAREWAGDKTWEEVYNTCHRGDWLMWLFGKTNPEDKRLRVLTSGHIANTVRHLMKDERSTKAVDVLIAYGEGLATEDELTAAAYAAYAAYAAASAGPTYTSAYRATYRAAYAAHAAVRATGAAYGAAYGAAAYAAHAAGDAYGAAADRAAYGENLKLSADIVRKYILIEKWNVNKQQGK